MALVEKTMVSRAKTLQFRRELQYLYARRETVDALIESLRSYERYQPKSVTLSRPHKSACA